MVNKREREREGKVSERRCKRKKVKSKERGKKGNTTRREGNNSDFMDEEGETRALRREREKNPCMRRREQEQELNHNCNGHISRSRATYTATAREAPEKGVSMSKWVSEIGKAGVSGRERVENGGGDEETIERRLERSRLGLD